MGRRLGPVGEGGGDRRSDLLVVPATTLATLRRDNWEVPAAIEGLAGVVSVSQRADRAKVRALSVTRGNR